MSIGKWLLAIWLILSGFLSLFEIDLGFNTDVFLAMLSLVAGIAILTKR